ncbi:MAG TPA: hypothetical protein VGM38_09410 [Pseudolysinimonas sp.]|jgi:hypothetical protein
MAADSQTTVDTAQMRRVADVPRTTDLARRLLHEAADELDRLRVASNKTAEAIIRDVAELEHNPLPGMHEDEDLQRAGFRVVPLEPTPEMLAAWYKVKNGFHYHDEPPPADTSDVAAYRALLGAAWRYAGEALNGAHNGASVMSAGQDKTTDGKEWARAIQNGATELQVRAVICAINRLTGSQRTNGAAVMVACAQILGQSIADAGPDIASEMRAGLLTLVDGFAMQVAVAGTEP